MAQHPSGARRDYDGSEAVRVRLLGGFEVSVGALVIEENSWRRRKAASLVKLLALAEGHRLHRDRISSLLWPGLDGKAAANNLHRALHFARAALGGGSANAASRYLPLRGDMLALCPHEQLWVDAEAFESAAATARRGREPAAYRAAVELYVGDLLPEDLYEPWTEEKRQELEQSYLALLFELAKLYEGRAEYEPAIEALRRVVADDPTKEEVHARLMRLHALLGRSREALLQYERLRTALREELGKEPGDASRRLYEAIHAGEFVPSPPDRPSEEPSSPSRHNLPASLASFVGRERALVEVRRLLSMTRLLTLTGAGGSGKTRLGLEVAGNLVGIYPDGVWLMELAELSDPALASRTVAAALGVREQPGRSITQALARHLGSRQTLLVFDNCEHLIDESARLAEALLRSCPKVRVLATSRGPLGVPGEIVWPIPTLSLPDDDGSSTVGGLMRAEAVRLFVDRARSRLPNFELNPENAGAVVRVCRKLDGIPLAIELATARMGALAVAQVAQRLERSLDLLTAGGRTVQPRQRTLRATLDWSHALLKEDEKTLFRRLSVFAGGWTLEAAEMVCSDNGRGDIPDLLSRLVDKSLVVNGSGAGEALRYRMLEPVRQYGREKLETTDADRLVFERHARYFLALAEEAEPELIGPRQGEWLERLRTEFANLRIALSWALEAERSKEHAELSLRLAASLWRFWDVQGFYEGKEWLEAALERDEGGTPTIRAKALGGLGWILLFQRDYGQAIAALEEAVTLYKELGNESGAAFTLGNLGYAVLHGGYRERVPAFVQEGEVSMHGDLDGHTRAFLRMTLASAAMEEGDLESAVAQLEENVALCRELGDLRNTSMSLFTLGMAELRRDDMARGAAALEEGARITRGLADRLGGVYYVWGLGMIAALRGEPARATKLWGAAEALREDIGMSLSYFDLAHSGYERLLASARASLDEKTWTAAWTGGRAMSPEQAIEFALSTEEPSWPATFKQPRSNHTDEAINVLTRREREVAHLIGRGLTNREIAEELAIRERTVEAHAGKILRKLGFRSRTQIATWIIQHERTP